MINEICKYDIASHFGTSILYGDDSGLNNDEIAEVEQFLKTEVCANGYAITTTDNSEEYTAVCDVCGLMAQCSEFLVYEVVDNG